MLLNRRSFIATSGAALATAAIGRPAHAAEFTYKLGHSTPAEHPFSIRLTEVAAEVLEKTGGRMEIQLFPASQLGGDNDLLSQVRSGAVEFFPGAGLILASVLPVTAIDGMGFAFPSYDKVWAAVDGDLGAYVAEQIRTKTNLVPVGRVWDLGYRQITNNVRPVVSADDLNGLKLRVPGAPALVSLFQGLGVAPVSMQFGEVYTALQTGVVDGQENPFATIDAGKFYEVQKYLAQSNHVWNGFWMLANADAWNRLPEDIQDIVNTSFAEKGLLQRADLAELNKGLATTLQSKGMELSTIDTDSFRAKLREAGFYADWREKIGGEAWEILESYAGKLG
ncbi:MAG: TRAP transporter substrate-binding protein [Rhodobiaceae bacterium]|nr:TRAP transporter substrate-binding protein [Rhodobiaceae bacterium]